MNVFLLYPDREWKGTKQYHDYKSIIKDLGLEILFRTASREQIQQVGAVQSIMDADIFLEDTMRRVMMVPIQTKEEMTYRQAVVRDFMEQEEFTRELYEFARETLDRWDKLGRKQGKRVTSHDAGISLVTDVHILRLFAQRLSMLKELIAKYEEQFQSEGLYQFAKRLREDYSESFEEDLQDLLDDIAFYVDKEANPYEWVEKRMVKRARIVMQCDISEGLKLNSFVLDDVETLDKKRKRQRHKRTWMQKYLGAFAPETTMLLKEDIVLAETKQLEYQIVRYIVSHCDSFVAECKEFFEQLAFQSGFYMGAFHLSQRMKRHEMDICYPTVGPQDSLCFDELKDMAMAIEQCTNPVGNQLDIRRKMLMIVTGANQGGKSTFLRSIGIAQVMMQCGLFVAARSYESGIYPSFFTHFTRREDSEMNSGRLDEELGRMSQIIEHVGERSLVLLNESFATTTEKEGSVIAYDIIKALTQSGVKVLTVTHLLSFAKKVYEEPHENVEFLSAQRKSDGSRTFKMIQHEPELTSFGLDLYDKIIP